MAAIGCCLLATILMAPAAEARVVHHDPDDVDFRLDIQRVAANGRIGKFRIHIVYREPVPWNGPAVIYVHLDSHGNHQFDYNLRILKLRDRRRCELQNYETGHRNHRKTRLTTTRRSVWCSVRRRALDPDRQIRWVVNDYISPYIFDLDRAPDRGIYPHA
jgi:hypothetical protein